MTGMTPLKGVPHFEQNKEKLEQCLDVVNSLMFAYKTVDDEKVEMLEEIYNDILQDFYRAGEPVPDVKIKKLKKPKLMKIGLRKKVLKELKFVLDK